MRPASDALKALLATGKFARAELYTITLVGGSVLRYSGADVPVTLAGPVVYALSGLNFARGAISDKVGLEVGELLVTVHADPDDATARIQGVPFAAFVRRGGLDGATLTLEYAFAPDWGQPWTGVVTRFHGVVAETRPGRTTTEIQVHDLKYLLNVGMPRNIYQPGCLHTLYDSGCALNKADFAVEGHVVNASPLFVQTDLTNPPGHFDLGVIRLDDGDLATTRRTVRMYSAGSFHLSLPLSAAPAIGTAITAWPGCDKLQATCTAKFDNIEHFRGFPFVPIPETAR